VIKKSNKKQNNRDLDLPLGLLFREKMDSHAMTSDGRRKES
jgi:hypothetical protein